MKRRVVLCGFIALLVIIAGTWGVLEIRSLAASQSVGGNHPVAASPTSLTSLYLTGTLVIPTVKVSTSTANCDPKNIPGVTSDPANGVGGQAIKPHLCSIPTFTEQDVREYMSKFTSFDGMRFHQTSPSYIITRILFITNQVANALPGLNADTGVADPNLIVCYVELYGDFSSESGLPSSTPQPQTILHHGLMVFDGITGNTLDVGVTT
jgi:hypothetical protein